MEHEEWKILVSAYHDGEVTAEERVLVEAHLAECAECAASFAAYGRLGRTLRHLPRGEPSRELWQRVQSGLASRRRWSLGWRLLPVAPVVAMVAIAITLIVVLGTSLGGGVRGVPSPALQKEAQVAEAPSPARGAPQASPLPPMAPEPSGTEGAEEYGILTAPPEVDAFAGLEVVSQTVRYDEDRTTPYLRGVLYDPAGQPLAGTALVVSDLVSWVGVVTTTDDGAFALDLPARGTYYVVLAGSPVAQKALGECWEATADAVVSETMYLSGTNAIPALVVVESSAEVVVTLRVR